MRIPISVFALAFSSHLGGAQATTVEEPISGFVENFMRAVGVSHAIGDLRLIPVADSGLEVRFWSIGWSMSGVRLQRSPSGIWTAHRIVFESSGTVRSEALAEGASNVQSLDSLWADLTKEGVQSLPTRVPRKWGRVDGHSYMVELRRGPSYRGMLIEHMERPEVPGDTAILRIAGAMKRRFPFLLMPAK